MGKITFNKFLCTLLLLAVFVAEKSGAQTQLIPVADGGFESGTTFAANGWSGSSGTAATNKWVCNTGATTGFLGTRCAFISRAANVHLYTLNAATSISHLYRDVTVPAGNDQITLNFAWICQGEGLSLNYDYLSVWAVPTTYNPAFNTAITAAGTAPTGTIQIGTALLQQGTWTNTTLTIPSSYAGTTFRLVFQWQNDGSGGTQPPAAIDNVSLISNVFVPLPNDNCAGAVTLPVNLSCSYTNATNATATASPSIPAPGCANYSTGDVWFKAVVPANGILNVSTQAGSMIDSGMALYSGTCAGLTLISCDDDSAGNFMSQINSTGLVPGSTVYIRVWSYGTKVQGTFGICATTLSPCAQMPTNLTNPTISASTATISWTAASPAPASGYQYYYSTNATAPTGATAPSGSVAAGVTSVNLTGLVANTTYYVWIRSNCNGTDFSAWTMIQIFTGYCAASGSSATYYINNFSTSGGTSNITNNGSGFSAGGYGNFTGMVAAQSPGLPLFFSAAYGNGTGTYGFNIWVDWNNNFIFDAGEKVFASGGYNGSNTGSFIVPAGTPSGNYRMRIRADFNSINPAVCGASGNSETEDYTINVSTLPCSGNPTNVSVNITTNTTATATWVGAVPAPVNGYEYYNTMSPTYPSPSTGVSGNTAAGITTVNISFLAAGSTYYFYVRSNCGGGLGSGAWIGPVIYTIPTCTVGNSQGTTSQACPNVLSGGLGLNGAPAPAINCTTTGCVQLEATYLQLGQPTSYAVQSIPYAPPYQFTCLKNPVSVNVDDVWSPIVNLPFQFCFYGNTYNKCVISSNGVISFDTTTNAPGSYSTWSFNSNIPDPGLFKNAIFGVYQDIDPSISGQVGWELITLNTGCRALVASWSKIPMFSCTTDKYTGMMVLYENTNIIEVYIQNKTICAFNNGNAIVGLQNASGTAATVAPGRNGLSPDWATTNEAWRFVPNGTSITSVKWYEGPTATGPVVGTGNTISVCPADTQVYTAAVSYALCSGRTLTEVASTTVTVEKDKIWNGNTNNAWGTAANWTPAGVPNATNCVVIPNFTAQCQIYGSNYNAYARSVRVENGGSLSVMGSSAAVGSTLTVGFGVTVETGGNMDLTNHSSLLQLADTPNSGIVKVVRKTRPMYILDYTYWNSMMTASSNFTVGALSPLTLSDKYYKWLPVSGNGLGTWINVPATGVMSPLQGYIIRAPQGSSWNPGTKSPFTATFVGTPNNGTMLIPVTRGTLPIADRRDKLNLIGNPYPSSLDVNQVLNNAANSAVIDGTIYIWTHHSPPSAAYPSPFYGTYTINYTASDYATYNKTGPTSTLPSGYAGAVANGNIASGQSFFVKALQNGNVTLTNQMRAGSGNNTQFFRNGDLTSTADEGDDNVEDDGVGFEGPDGNEHIVRNRMWLNIANASGAFSQTLIGYVDGATDGYDRGFDGDQVGGNAVSLYTMIDDAKMTIQAFGLTFTDRDKIPLGYKSTGENTYTIGIDHVDGLFEGVNIYLNDKVLDIMHPLKESAYTFASAGGEFNDRFVIVFETPALGTTDFSALNGVKASINGGQLKVAASTEMKSITVYDVTGKEVISADKMLADKRNYEKPFNFAQGVYFAKIKLEDGKLVTKKLINK